MRLSLWMDNELSRDDFLYKNHYSAQNAIDRALGDEGQRGSEKRKSYGIQIVGKKSKELNQ